MAVKVSEALKLDQRLWRYMSLDKLIDLLSNRSLYMATADQFKGTDPYEGQDHPQVMQAWADIMRPPYEQNKALLQQAERDAREGRVDLEALARLQKGLADFPEATEQALRKVANSVRSSCWHGNEGESEAMWKLYGDSGKSVAIVTTVGSLARSVDADAIDEVVDIVPVKYLDFERQYHLSEVKNLLDRITVTKRLAYQHEQEVRLTVRPAPADPRRWQQPDFGKPDPIHLPIDLVELIHEVHISPYPAAPFAASVRVVCDLFGLKEQRIKTSALLTYKQTSLAHWLVREF